MATLHEHIDPIDLGCGYHCTINEIEILARGTAHSKSHLLKHIEQAYPSAAILTLLMMFVPASNTFPTNSRAGSRHIVSLTPS